MKILIVGHDIFEDVIIQKSTEIREHLQEGYKYYLEPLVVVYKRSNCWKIAAKCVSRFLGSTKVLGDGLSVEGTKQLIENAGYEIVIVVVNFDKSEEVVTLLESLGCTGKESQINQMDLTKNLICFNQKTNLCRIF